ncbi:MAG: hypothetical protein Q7T86_16570 [Hyphomicrobiaceae bacterium]|nr:hypothetical protein [Hyphomicrobiaceae bacterium]
MKYLNAAVVSLALSTPVLAAEYYVVQDKTTKKCKVVSTKPTEETWVVVGNTAFKTQTEADEQVKVVCKEKH